MPKLKSVDFTGEMKNSSLEQKLRELRDNSMSSIEDELDEVTED